MGWSNLLVEDLFPVYVRAPRMLLDLGLSALGGAFVGVFAQHQFEQVFKHGRNVLARELKFFLQHLFKHLILVS